MDYATGKFAKGLCDRCGFEYKLLELKEEWNGLKVCPNCYEPKHPQLDPGHHPADAIALRDPRPARQEPVTVFAGSPGDSAFESNGMIPSTQSTELLIGSTLGTVSVVIS